MYDAFTEVELIARHHLAQRRAQQRAEPQTHQPRRRARRTGRGRRTDG